MLKFAKLCVLSAVLSVILAASASAQTKQWINTCSSGSLVTCASVRLNVSGTTVTLQVWNTSSGTAANSATGYRGSVFYQVAIKNIPATVQATTSLNQNGPTFGAPAKWVVTGTNPSGAGIIARNATGTGVSRTNGIASNCATSAGGTNLVSGVKLWMNPQCGSTNVTNPTMNSGWVNMTMFVDETWNPANTEIVIDAIDEQGRLYQINTYVGGSVTPEPVTVVLLGTGLAGLGLGMRRRRRRIDADITT